ncbi:hypothetical protein Ancab_032510 [Ancistrocladus abbreviatus]
MAVNNHKKRSTPRTHNSYNRCRCDPDPDPDTSWPSATVYLTTTINSISAVYRAHINNDVAVIILVVSVYVGCFLLDRCFTALKRLPPGQASRRKELLECAIWLLTAAIFIGFACQFADVFRLAASLSVFAIVTAVSACIICSYFLPKDVNCCHSSAGKVTPFLRPPV